ncbi:MAG: type II toxin-antitoxin system RelE/ParE family toxin [Gammaproteobacteria bacterium]
MKAEFHPAACEELLETAAYYEDQIPGLGERFIVEVERVAGVLADQPVIGQRIGVICRRILLVRFPFSLIYSIEPDGIWILAVAHHRRRPGYWKERTDR